MMKLSSIHIQGMHNVEDKTYSLSNMNYFVGPNGAGKSTAMQAIQLALLGYIPGTDKKKSAIFQHSNGQFMSVSLVLEDGNKQITINRTWNRKGKDVVAAVNTVPDDIDVESIIGEISLPILNFNEFISMTSNKLKDWFINFLPNSDSSIDWDKKLRQEIADYGKLLSPEYVTEIITYVTNLKSKGLDQIREFNAFLKQQQSFKKTELTRVQGTIQSLIFYDDCDNSVDVCTLKEQNRVDSLIKDNINHQLLRISNNKKIDAQLSLLTEIVSDSLESDNRYQENLSNIAAADKVIAECNNTISNYSNSLAALKQKRADKVEVINGAGVCPYSGSVCESIRKLLDVFKSDVENIDADIIRFNDERSAKEKERVAADTQKRMCENHNAKITTQYSQYASLKKQYDFSVVDLEESMLQKNLKKTTSDIEARNDLIIKLEANKQYNELTHTLTAQKFQIEQELEILKAWIKLTDVNGMQSTIMEAPFNNLAGKMSEYLNKFFNRDDLTAAFHLTQEANSFSFGIRKTDNTYLEFDLLSSGEKCLYTLSLMLGLIETSATQLPIILIDDLLDHLDQERIASCFETLYDIDNVQVLLAGVQTSPIAEGIIEV